MRHCDDYIDDETQPEALRKFLEHARAPAHGAYLDTPTPKLLAKLAEDVETEKRRFAAGTPVRVVMASRFGDVGITTNLNAEHGYDARVAVSELCDFTS